MKILIFRSGAYGDCLIITPVIRYLHQQGHKLVVVTSKRGMEVFKGNPHIEKLLQHDEGVKVELLAEHIDYLKRKNHCDRVIDFSESIEVALSQHPRGSDYKLTKPERIARFNRNFYEYAFEHAGENPSLWDEAVKPISIGGVKQPKLYQPELFFDPSELDEARQHLKPDCFNVLIGLAGSGTNKAWPWIMDFCNETGKRHPNVHFITVGDIKCEVLEDIETPDHDNFTKLSGKISMRQSMALTSMVDLVIAPDTGIIHAAGCYDTPKICILGHNTIECITKHFTNDYSLEADEKLAPCAPCLFLIYDRKMQCPLGEKFGASLCMEAGVSPERVYEQFRKVYDAKL